MGIFGSTDPLNQSATMGQLNGGIQNQFSSGGPGSAFQPLYDMAQDRSNSMWDNPLVSKLMSLLGPGQQQSSAPAQQPTGPVGSTLFNPWQQVQAYTPNPGIDTSSLPQPQSYQPTNPSTSTAQGMGSLMNTMPGSNISPSQYSFPMTGGGMVSPYQGYGSIPGINISTPQLIGGTNPSYTMGTGERSFSDTASPGMLSGLFGSGGSSSSGAN